ncbi:MAG TPA: GNAT family N-acetyltransferase [Planctomycetaceae bacterium]
MDDRPDDLEIVRLRPDLTAAVAAFFAEIHAAGDDRKFHPHPFTAEEAERLCRYEGKDVYAAMTVGGRVAGYGMLRGWDAGYAVPSLGIAVSPAFRGRSLGRLMMTYLHAAAAVRGAEKVRLKVYRDNAPAKRLYESLGYVFDAEEGPQLVGHIRLAA